MYDSAKKDDVLKKVSIPMYFYNIIVPQLGGYYADYPVNFEAKLTACCPLHDEDTPSFRFYEETNSFFCFGCKKGGDVINLHRLFTEKQTGNKPSFNEAVEFLYEFFIRGNNSIVPIKTTKKLVQNKVLSSKIDLARYNIYIKNLSDQLYRDNKLDNKIKIKLWNAIDTSDILVNLNLVNAIESMNYIKSIVFKSIT